MTITTALILAASLTGDGYFVGAEGEWPAVGAPYEMQVAPGDYTLTVHTWDAHDGRELDGGDYWQDEEGVIVSLGDADILTTADLADGTASADLATTGTLHVGSDGAVLIVRHASSGGWDSVNWRLDLDPVEPVLAPPPTIAEPIEIEQPAQVVEVTPEASATAAPPAPPASTPPIVATPAKVPTLPVTGPRNVAASAIVGASMLGSGLWLRRLGRRAVSA